MAVVRVRERLAELWRRRRNRWLLALLVALVALRIALPAVVRRIAIDQADQALAGRIELDDVDLSLVGGIVTLKGLRVFADEKPAPATPGKESGPAPVTTGPALAAGRAPVVVAGRLMVNVGFLPFLRKTLEVQRLELDQLAVSLDRARDGTLVLPQLVPSEPPEEPALPKGSGWGVLLRAVTLRGGTIGFRDFALGDPPQTVAVTLPNLDAEDLALAIQDGGLAPGKVVLDAGIAGGTLHFEATIESLPVGPAVESRVVLAGIPIHSSRRYLPRVEWSDLAGRLDADLVHRFESGGAHTLRGRLALRDLVVRVDRLDDPAIAWKGLAVDLGSIDLAQQHAKVDAVTLDGLRIVARPTGPEPLPVLRGLIALAGDAGEGKPDARAPAVAPAAAKHEAPPWTWEVASVQLRDARVKALLADEVPELGVEAGVTGLASAPGTTSALSLQLVPQAGGPLAVTGAFTLEPIGLKGAIRGTGLIVPPLARISGAAPAKLLTSAVLGLDLEVAAGAVAEAPPDGARVAGTISLADVVVAGEDPKSFGVRWKELSIALRELVAPGVLASGPDAKRGPIGVALSSLTLTRPEIALTRTKDGIALPPEIAPPAAEGGATPGADGAPDGAIGATPPLEVQLRVDQLAVRRMRLGVIDKSVKPVYRGSLDPIDLRARDVRWPGPFARNVRLVAKGLGGATFTVKGNVAPAGSALVAKLEGLPLAPFDPYAKPSGYGVGGGSARLDSTVALGPGRYDTKSKLVLSGLQVTGSEGDALFAAQFGMPLSLALSLMTDLSGNIVLDLPVAGDAAGMKVGIGTIVRNTLARAILNAVTSPLKLLGAVANIGDKPTSLAPQPLVFRPGRDALAEGEEASLATITKLLAATPALAIHLRGETSDEDRRWLQEQALRAKLEEESGVLGRLRHITERGERIAALAALNERAAGKPGDIPTEHEAWFEEQVKAQVVSDAALGELAAARARKIQAHFLENGIAAERVPIDTASPDDLAARPVVALGLGDAAARAPSAGEGLDESDTAPAGEPPDAAGATLGDDAPSP